MAEQLSFSQFAMIPIASENDWNRPGTLIWEYFQATLVVSSNLGEVEVPTNLGEVLGVVSLGFMSTFAAGDTAHGLSTDGVISTSAVTVRGTTVSLADGSYTIHGFLVGKKSDTVLSFS